MQKHERETLARVREVVTVDGWTVDIEPTTTAKMRLAVHTPAGSRYKFVSSSPKDRAHEVAHAVRWARRVMRELGTTVPKERAP